MLHPDDGSVESWTAEACANKMRAEFEGWEPRYLSRFEYLLGTHGKLLLEWRNCWLLSPPHSTGNWWIARHWKPGCIRMERWRFWVMPVIQCLCVLYCWWITSAVADSQLKPYRAQGAAMAVCSSPRFRLKSLTSLPDWRRCRSR